MARRFAELPVPRPVRARSDAENRRGARAIIFAFAACCVLVPLVGRLWSRTELIAPVNPNVQTLAIFVGTFAGVGLVGAIALRMFDRAAGDGRPAFRGLADAVAGGGLCVLIATWCARSLVECWAFAGLSPVAFPATFAVVGTEQGSHGARSVRVRFGPAGREFSVPASWSAFDAAHPGETVTLPVETGRDGIQRALLPAHGLAAGDLRGA